MGGHSECRVPYPSLPVLHHQPIRQGRPHQPPASVRQAAPGQKTDQCRFDRLSQRRQEFGHQHTEDEEGAVSLIFV